MPLRDLVLVVLVCITWAFNFIASAKGMQHFSPSLFMILRFSMLLLIMGAFIRFPPRGHWFHLGAACLFMGAGHFAILLWALERSADVSSIVIAVQCYVPMSVILAMVMLGERIGWRTLVALTMAFAGVVVVSFDPMVFQQLDALAIALLSALCQALGSIYMRGIKGVSVFNFQAWTAVISMPVMIVSSLVLDQNQWQTLLSAQPIHWAAAAYAAVGASIIGHGFYFILIQRNPVSTIMPYMLLSPVIAVIFGVVIWGDQPGPRLLAGGMLVLLGILIITLRARRRSIVEPNFVGD